jgi:hypothetical protein
VDGAETQCCVVRDFEDARALGRSVRWTVEYTSLGAVNLSALPTIAAL